MTKAQTRRAELVRMLGESSAPIAGGALADALGVSRQIIVQDIALLREAGKNIVATTKGYLLSPSEDDAARATGNANADAGARGEADTDGHGAEAEPFTRTLKVHHGVEQTRDELETIIAAGGRTKNVSINHRAYGRVTAPLNIATPEDIDRFIDDIESGKSSPLSTATSGYHYHLIAADSEATLDAVEQALAEKGYLAPLLPYERG